MFTERQFEALFPTGLWIFEVQGFETLNRKLAQLVYKLQREGSRARSGATDGIWQTSDRLHQREDMKEFVALALGAMKEVMAFLEYEYDELTVTGMWANINKKDRYLGEHTHPNNFLSGVYYVKAPAGCGAILFKDPRGQTQIFEPKVKRYNQMNTGYARYDPAEGAFFIFPSWLEHKVLPNKSGQDRISISFNAMFRGRVGDPDTLTYSEF